MALLVTGLPRVNLNPLQNTPIFPAINLVKAINRFVADSVPKIELMAVTKISSSARGMFARKDAMEQKKDVTEQKTATKISKIARGMSARTQTRSAREVLSKRRHAANAAEQRLKGGKGSK